MPRTLFLTLSLIVLGICVTSSYGQESSVSLSTGVRGTVKDPSLAVVPNASVRLTSDVSPAVEIKTDGDGNYSFAGLRAGNYSVSVSASGFSAFQGQLFPVVAGQTIQQNVTLVTAGTTTVAEVTADAPRVETNDPSVYSTLSAKELTGLQLNGRNFIQLIALTPGVSNQTGQDEASVGVQGSAAFSVNGGRTEYNTFDLDGSDLLNVGFNGGINTLMVYPSLDAIGEMRILTSNYGAMYGRTASGTVLVSTKSGTNEFHGNLYYFNRNEAFNARNFFDETKGAPLYRRHDAGGTIGGPVYIPGLYNKAKDKTFFFYSQEWRNDKTPFEFNQGVPSVTERNGDFNDVCPPGPGSINGFLRSAYPDCPTSGIAGADLGQVFTYTQFPTNNIFGPDNSGFIRNVPNRNAAAILATGIIPLPNRTSGCNSSINSCFSTTVSEPTHWHEELARIDQYFNERNRLMFRFVHDSWDTVTGTPQYTIISNTTPSVQNYFKGPGINLVARFSQTLSPTLLNEVYASYANSRISLTNLNGSNSQVQRPATLDAPCSIYPAVSPNSTIQCGLGSFFNNGSGGKIPSIQLLGNLAYGGGLSVDTGYMPWSHTNPIYTFGDTVTKQWGKHFIQGGSEFTFYVRDQTNSVSGAATGETQGIFSINSLGARTGNAFADFLSESILSSQDFANQQSLTGANGQYQQDSTQLRYHQRYAIAEPYIQDDWKVTPRLTVNMGLRLSLFGQYHEANDNVYNWQASAFNTALASQIVVAAAGQGYGGGTITSPAIIGVAGNSQVSQVPLYFDPKSPTAFQINGLVRCGYNGVPSSCQSGHLFNPAPRVGFAWDPFGDGKISLRAGYGIFFEHGTGNESNTGSLEGSAPSVLSVTQGLSDLSCVGYSNPTYCGLGSLHVPVGQIAAYPLNLTSIQAKTQWPYAQQWSLSIQRELPKRTILSVAYVGSKGTHLTAERQINAYPALPASQNPFGPHENLNSSVCTLAAGASFGASKVGSFTLPNGQLVNPGTPLFNNLSIACIDYLLPQYYSADINTLRPYQGIGQIVAVDNIANSSYNAFQATLRHTTGALTLGLSYTYSHSLDSSSDRFNPVPNSFDLHSNWASSNFDQRHLLNISYIYDLPNPSSWKNRRLLRNTVGGWQLSGITVFQTGIPFSIISNPGASSAAGVSDNAGTGNLIGVSSTQSYADLAGDPHAKPPAAGNNGTTFGPLLDNPSVYVVPRALTFGNSGRNSLNNPSRWNFDMSLFKNFTLKEGTSLQLRAEGFNVFNITQFELYNPAKGNQSNNTITCYGDATTGYSAGASNCLIGNSFLRPIDAHRPRTLQLALKLTF